MLPNLLLHNKQQAIHLYSLPLWEAEF